MEPSEHTFDIAQMCCNFDTQSSRYEEMSASQIVQSWLFKFILIIKFMNFKFTRHTQVAWLETCVERRTLYANNAALKMT